MNWRQAPLVSGELHVASPQPSPETSSPLIGVDEETDTELPRFPPQSHRQPDDGKARTPGSKRPGLDQIQAMVITPASLLRTRRAPLDIGAADQNRGTSQKSNASPVYDTVQYPWGKSTTKARLGEVSNASGPTKQPAGLSSPPTT